MDDNNPLISIPKDFGPFELLEKVGSGGMGLVYLAIQKSLRRKVVLKILHAHFADDETLVTRFEREATAAAQLRHPNIVNVIDTGRFKGVPYIAMEYIDGMDLQRWFKKHPAPPVEVALVMVRDICRGLEHAHESGVVHRDIKPANVMMSQDGAIKIMDFGLARVITESIAVTAAGSVLGTPRYMSPEQATGEAVDARSDIFSTGVLAFEFLTGQCPFGGDSYSAVIHSILHNDPEPVQTFNPVVPRSCAALIRKMLRKEKTERFQDMNEVLEALGAVLEAMHIGHSKDLLRDYARDPEGTTKALADQGVQTHLALGRELEMRGPFEQDQAFLEYMRVLHLSPGLKEAEQRVNILRAGGAKLPTEEAGPGDGAPLLTSAPSLPPVAVAGIPKKKTRFSFGNVMVALGIVLLVVFAGVLLLAPRLLSPVSTINITTNPPGATVTLDGKLMQTQTPARYSNLKAGMHSLRVVLEGYPPQDRSVALRPNETSAQMFDFDSNASLAGADAKATQPGPGSGKTEQPTEPAADPSTATISVRTSPAGARVTLDGRAMPGRTNTTFRGLKPGAHSILVTLDGYEDHQEDFTAAAGKTASLHYALAAKPSKFGMVAFKMEPGSSVTVDGRPVAAADLSAPVRIPVGTHAIKVSAPGGKPMEQSLTIAENETQSVDYTGFLGNGSILVDTTVRGLVASIWLDGRDTGRKAPGLIRSVSARDHKLRLVSGDHEMVGGDTTISVASGHRTDVTVRMTRR